MDADDYKATLLELERRERKLVALQQRLAELRSKLERTNQRAQRLSRSAAQAMTNEAYRTKLRGEIAATEKDERDALAEVKRARERKEILESELAEAPKDDQ